MGRIVVVLMIVFACNISYGEDFKLKSEDSGMEYGPFGYYDGARVKLDNRIFRIIKTDGQPGELGKLMQGMINPWNPMQPLMPLSNHLIWKKSKHCNCFLFFSLL